MQIFKINYIWKIQNKLRNKNSIENHFGKTKLPSDDSHGLLYFQLNVRFLNSENTMVTDTNEFNSGGGYSVTLKAVAVILLF